MDTAAALASASELVAQGRPREALARLEEVLRSAPDNPDLQAGKGRLLCLFQREDEALDCWEKARGAAESDALGADLFRYLHSRRQLAARMGIQDAAGEAMWRRLEPSIAPAWRPHGIRLSAVLIAKNEETNLPRCLKSLEGRVDEIVVVDTGSSDRTVQVAREFGATVGDFSWRNDFAAARNAALELATGDWALWIDADEEVVPESWSPIREAIIRPHFGGYFVRMVNYTDEAENSTYTHSPIRLFQLRPEIRFEGKIHEQIGPAIARLGLPTAQLEGVTLFHYGYKPSEMEAKGKVDRTISMLLEQVAEEPDEPFHWFNLANAYSVAGRHDDCVETAGKCLAIMPPQHNFASLTHQLLAGSLNALSRPSEALDAGLAAKRNGCFTILNQFEMAHSLLLLGRSADALTAIEACQAMDWPDDMTGDRGIATHKSHVLQGQALIALGRFEEGLSVLDRALTVDPNFGLAHCARALALESLGRTAEAHEAVERGLALGNCGLVWLRHAARIANLAGHPDRGRELSRAALDASPDDLESWSYWAQAIELEGDPAEMIAAYEYHADRHPPHPEVLVNWGRALTRVGQAEAGARKFEEAIRLDPGHANAYANMGDLLYQCGAYSDAADCYQSALRSDPANPDIWFCLGNSAGQLGAWGAAQTAYRQALVLDPDHAGAAHNLQVAEQESAA